MPTGKAIKYAVVLIGVVTAAVVLAWNFQTKPLQESGVRYIQEELYQAPEVVAAIGKVEPGRIYKYVPSKIGAQFRLEIYESVLVRGTPGVMFVEIKAVKDGWKVERMSLLDPTPAVALVANGEWGKKR